MPELPEVERYRLLVERRGLGRVIESVFAPDPWFLKGSTVKEEVEARLVGARFTGARRIGKLLLLDIDDDSKLGMRFGMTGTLVIGDEQGVPDMQYGSHRMLPEWNRFSLTFTGGLMLAINDPRRLGGVELDPPEEKLGVDALSVSLDDLAGMAVSSAPVKAWIMDQSRIAGVGNLLADEILWRAGVDPAKPAKELGKGQVSSLAELVPQTVRLLMERGGSHQGDLMPERQKGGHCPKDGTLLDRRKVGGRTTYSCGFHQK